MTRHLFVGVDGGATKCIVRVEDEAGTLLGQTLSGPANIRISVEETWRSIQQALQQILSPLGLSQKETRIFAGMGLAGCEKKEAYQAFLRYPHSFHALKVTSDAHTACLGAHGGGDGAIIIAGTGVVGYQIQNDKSSKVSGWGFPHDDQGGGAWIGLQALQLTFQALDGRVPVSNLTKAIDAYFNHEKDKLVTWANEANSTQFAMLAPLVIQQAQQKEPNAMTILKQAAVAIENVANALRAQQLQAEPPLSVALIGGITAHVQTYLSLPLQAQLSPCQAPPEQGAIMLIRKQHESIA